MTSPNKVTRWAICKCVFVVFMPSPNKVARWAICKGVYFVFMTSPNKVTAGPYVKVHVLCLCLLLIRVPAGQ